MVNLSNSSFQGLSISGSKEARFPKAKLRKTVLSVLLEFGRVSADEILELARLYRNKKSYCTSARDCIKGLRSLGWEIITVRKSSPTEWVFDGQDGFSREQILNEMVGLK